MPCDFPRKKKLLKEAGKTFRETNKRSGGYRAKGNGDKVAWAAKREREVAKLGQTQRIWEPCGQTWKVFGQVKLWSWRISLA